MKVTKDGKDNQQPRQTLATQLKHINRNLENLQRAYLLTLLQKQTILSQGIVSTLAATENGAAANEAGPGPGSMMSYQASLDDMELPASDSYALSSMSSPAPVPSALTSSMVNAPMLRTPDLTASPQQLVKAEVNSVEEKPNSLTLQGQRSSQMSAEDLIKLLAAKNPGLQIGQGLNAMSGVRSISSPVVPQRIVDRSSAGSVLSRSKQSSTSQASSTHEQIFNLSGNQVLIQPSHSAPVVPTQHMAEGKQAVDKATTKETLQRCLEVLHQMFPQNNGQVGPSENLKSEVVANQNFGGKMGMTSPIVTGPSTHHQSLSVPIAEGHAQLNSQLPSSHSCPAFPNLANLAAQPTPAISASGTKRGLGRASKNSDPSLKKKYSRMVDPQNRSAKDISDIVEIFCYQDRERKTFHCAFPGCHDNSSKGWKLKLRCKTHIEADHLNIKYKCPYCHFLSSRDDNLPKHVAKKHPDQNEEFKSSFYEQ